MKVHVETYGCQMNEYDSAMILTILEAAGHERASGLADADVVIVNTCAVRARAETRVLGMTLIEQLLDILTNPNIVFLLLSIGVQAILIEISSPGGWVAGFIGAVCLALAAYGLDILLTGWSSREEFRRRASVLNAGMPTFQYARTRTKNLMVPMVELNPLGELFEKVRLWEAERNPPTAPAS
jgi:hypothetical protein